MCVPLHLILQQARPYGARMFKAPEEEPEYRGYGWMGGIATKEGGPPDLKDNEYRFWKGTNFIFDGTSWAQCRECMVVCRSEELRKKHQKSMECTKILVKAYKLLLAGKKCVVCDGHTTAQKWGIPMCAIGDCREDFKTRAYMHGLRGAIKGNAPL